MASASGRIHGFTIDVSDLDRSLAFWGRVLGVEAITRDDHYLWMGPMAPGLVLALQLVGEVKTVKNRVHFELTSEDPDGFMRLVEEIGGTRLAEVETESYALTVMADPDGNEFCVNRRPSAALASERDAKMGPGEEVR